MSNVIISNEDRIINELLDSLKELTSTVVVKNKKLSSDNETHNSRKDFDYYYIAYNKLDTFTTYRYTAEELRAVGVPEPMIPDCIRDPENVPQVYRQSLLDNRRDKILTGYIEYNNYHRMLYGLPDNGRKYLYIPYPVEGIDEKLPIHMMSDDDIAKLTDLGVIAEMKKENPTEAYLNYLGVNKIHFYNSRIARNLDIIKLNSIGNETLENNFKVIYSESKEYIIRVLYNPIYENQKYYNGVMGMFTLYTAIQRTLTDYFNTVIKRDFFDMESIKNMFESYGVEFFEDIPLKYQVKMLKNLNQLLKYKGTNTVLVDICNLFGLQDANVSKYYIYKEHNLDEYGNVEFHYKEDGSLDYEQTYTLNFVKAPIDEFRIDNYIYDLDNRLSYDSVTANDKYWSSTEDPIIAKEKLLKEDFNYIESKYISINNMYNISDMMFEVNYFMRMLLDSYDKVKNIKLAVNSFGLDNEIDIFQAHVVLFALICAKHKTAGNIPKSLTNTLHLYGFNLDVDLSNVMEYMRNNGLNESSVEGFGGIMNNATKAQLINQFFNNISVKNNLYRDIRNTKSGEKYRSLISVYKSLLITEQTNEMYTKSDDTVADTYLDYVQDFNYSIYQLIVDAQNPYNVNKLNEYIDEVLTALDETLGSDEFKYLYNNISSISGDAIKRYVYKVIGFFKSFTVQLDSLSTIYMMDDRVFNNIRQFDKLLSSKFIRDATRLSGTNVEFLRRNVNKQHTSKIRTRDELVFRRGGK